MLAKRAGSFWSSSEMQEGSEAPKKEIWAPSAMIIGSC